MSRIQLFALLVLSSVFSLTSFGQVIVSEIVANNTKVEDEDTDSPSWFELHNTSSDPAVLDGWYLTNSDDAFTQWQIKQLTLPGNSVRLIFASGKDRPLTAATVEDGFLHTNFGLPNGGGYLALVEPDGTTVADATTYPELEKNLAYGRSNDTTGYMFPATPHTINSATPAPNGLTPVAVPSHKGGIIEGPIDLTLEVPEHPEATIQYAFGETDPSLFTPTYTSSVRIDKSVSIRVRAQIPDHLPSRITQVGFLLLDETLTNFAGTGGVFDSNIPVMVIDSFGSNLNSAVSFKTAYSVVIPTDEETGRASLLGKTDYRGTCGAHLRGESSSGFGQKSYAYEVRDADGDDRDVSLLGMPADSDWAIYGPWSEKSLMRNKLVFDWMRALRGADGTSVRTRFVEVFVNQSGSETIGYNSYQGVHLLMEKIKRGADRVPIENINEHTTDPDMITGGYIIRKDKPDGGKTNWSTSGGFSIALQSFDPDQINDAQLDYLRGYINTFERALKGDDFMDPERGYRKYMDPDTFIDAQWLLEISKQVDGYVFSTYWHKPRDGKLRAGPLWDFNISLGNADYATGDKAKGWLYDNRGGRGQIWYPRLHDDPEYHLAHWDRYWHMRQTILSDDAIDSAIDGHMATLLDGYTEPVGNREPDTVQNPVARHFRKHPFLGNRQWPNPALESRLDTWQDQTDYLRDWLKDRIDWLDDQSIVVDSKVHRAPRFSDLGGDVSGPVELIISRFKGGLFDSNKYAEGVIYYTVDGTDPRLEGGEINPTAVVYEQPLSLQQATTVSARLLNGETWSPQTSATFRIETAAASAENLVISEIMYHPSDPTPIESFAGFYENALFEFVEITNISTQVVDLTGLQFTNGIVFDFATVAASDRLMQPGESLLLVGNLEGFRKRHRAVDPALILGVYTGRLDNSGERLTISNASGKEIVTARYNDNADLWPAAADGAGYSLVLKSASSGTDLDDPTQWAQSEQLGGNPGEATITPSGEGSGSVGSPTEDSDNDGLSDFTEFALGSDPNDPRSHHVPVASVSEVDGNPFLTLTFQRNLAATDYSYIIETSSDLSSWVALEDPVNMGSIPQDDGTALETYRDADSMTRGRSPRFARLRISAPIAGD